MMHLPKYGILQYNRVAVNQLMDMRVNASSGLTSLLQLSARLQGLARY